MSHLLSKSKYIRGLQCDRALWLDVFNPRLARYTAEQMRRFDRGRDFEYAFKSTFPDGIDLSAELKRNVDAYPARTAELLDRIHTPSPLRGTPPNLGGEQKSVAAVDEHHLGSSPKLGEGDRREAVVEEYVRIMFSPCAEGERASGDDEVYLYAYCPEMEQGVLSAPAYRRMGSVQLTLPERWQGKEVHLYGFAVDYEGNASDTTYIGSLSPVETRPAASLRMETAKAQKTNSHSVVNNNLWHGSCSWNNSCNFATRNQTQWKQT